MFFIKQKLALRYELPPLRANRLVPYINWTDFSIFFIQEGLRAEDMGFATFEDQIGLSYQAFLAPLGNGNQCTSPKKRLNIWRNGTTCSSRAARVHPSILVVFRGDLFVEASSIKGL
jgi:hypothetical protein